MKEIKDAVAVGDMGAVLGAMFDVNSGGTPSVRVGFRRENQLWDYKAGLPGMRIEYEAAWAEVAAHVLAFHNAEGGILIFGVRDKDYGFVGTRDYVDGKRFNDKIRRYTGDTFWVDFSREFLQKDQRYLGIALIPPRSLVPVRMQADAPADARGERLFRVGDLCVRENDERRFYRGPDAHQYLARNRLPSPDARYAIRDGQNRIFRPDWDDFVFRPMLCERVRHALADDRTYVATLSGIGGVGKTALATWGVLEAYRKKLFEYIISVSAKDRELTSHGIRRVDGALTSYEGLLNEILDVTGFSEQLAVPVEEKEQSVRELLAGTSILLFVDNLETVVDDSRLVQFLETLPKPVKAITTSRVAAVRTAAFPITVGPLEVAEGVLLFEHRARQRGREELRHATAAEKQRIVEACACVPLAIEWLVGQSTNISGALTLAQAMTTSGRRDEELLEFCFRRVHSSLPEDAQQVLNALSLDDRPQVVEALSAATGKRLEAIDSALVALQECALVERLWDAQRRDFSYKAVTLTRRFSYREVQRNPRTEAEIRRRLSDWYEGRDVADTDREMVRAIRRGAQDPEAALVDQAILRRRVGQVGEAQDLFVRAIDRNPSSWRARREYAELLRDTGSIGAALEQYEQAANQAPRRGTDRALVFREWGMLLRKSGLPEGRERAVEKFEEARKDTPNDPVLNHALGSCLVSLGRYRLAIEILKPLATSTMADTRARTYPVLLICYEKLNEFVAAAELRAVRANDRAAQMTEVGSRRSVDTSSRPFVPHRGPEGNPQRKRRR